MINNEEGTDQKIMDSGQKEQPPPGFRVQIGRVDYQPQDGGQRGADDRDLGAYPDLPIVGLPESEM